MADLWNIDFSSMDFNFDVDFDDITGNDKYPVSADKFELQRLELKDDATPEADWIRSESEQDLMDEIWKRLLNLVNLGLINRDRKLEKRESGLAEVAVEALHLGVKRRIDEVREKREWADSKSRRVNKWLDQADKIVQRIQDGKGMDRKYS